MNKPSPELKNGKLMKCSFTLTKLPLAAATAAIVAAAFIFTGCKPKAPTTVATPKAPPVTQPVAKQPRASNVQQPVTSAPDVQPPPAVAPPTKSQPAQWTPDTVRLSAIMNSWYFEHQRSPTNWDEFVTDVGKRGILIPPAPPGMKYETDRRMRVKLVPK